MQAIDDTIEITKAEARALLKHASTDETRKHLCSVLFELNGKATAVATDGHRLARCEVENGSGFEWTALVPRTTLEEAAKLASAKVPIRVKPQKITVGAATVTYEERQDVKFPPYQQVIPERSDDPKPGVAVNTAYLASLDLVGKAVAEGSR
jgi:DNA polymerase III sliding clamp (beta) subunit (PCNA family)